MGLFRLSLLTFGIWGATLAGVAQSGHIARLTSTEGTVRIDRADASSGDIGVLNMPLIEGSTVATGVDGQAEVEFEDGSLARLTPNTSITLARIGSAAGTQLALDKGLAYFELRAAPGVSYTVIAADDRLHPTENTTVRVNLDEPPPAIAVLDGALRVEHPGSYATDVRAGETFRADVSGAGRYFLSEEIAPDTWDAWNETRDQQAADAAARQTDARGNYAGDKGYGWSDLDANGTWYDAGHQGQVWQPEGGDTADFDPYGNGNWVWYPTAGYVWASAYPWGWTPFRCGSWSYWGGFGWGWVPAGNCFTYGFGGTYGGYGGYGGGGGFVNIRLTPRGYPVHRPPTPGRPGLHPIVRVRDDMVLRASGTSTGPRMIGGVRAVPLHGTAASYTTHGGSATGAALLRDYPVDRATRTPVIGVQAASSFSSPGSRPGTTTNGIPVQTIYGNVQAGNVQAGNVQAGRGAVAVQRNPAYGGVVRPGQSPAYPSAPIYGRAPLTNAQPQRSQQVYVPRSSAPAQVSRPAPSAPAPAPHMSAPASAPAPSGKK